MMLFEILLVLPFASQETIFMAHFCSILHQGFFCIKRCIRIVIKRIFYVMHLKSKCCYGLNSGSKTKDLTTSISQIMLVPF